MSTYTCTTCGHKTQIEKAMQYHQQIHPENFSKVGFVLWTQDKKTKVARNATETK